MWVWKGNIYSNSFPLSVLSRGIVTSTFLYEKGNKSNAASSTVFRYPGSTVFCTISWVEISRPKTPLAGRILYRTMGQQTQDRNLPSQVQDSGLIWVWSIQVAWYRILSIRDGHSMKRTCFSPEQRNCDHRRYPGMSVSLFPPFPDDGLNSAPSSTPLSVCLSTSKSHVIYLEPYLSLTKPISPFSRVPLMLLKCENAVTLNFSIIWTTFLRN